MTKIHQIYYDKRSKESLDPGFIPLNNEMGDPRWFEFSAIRNFFENNEISDDVYYGFLSPKFYGKTGLTSTHLYNKLLDIEDNADAVIVNSAWDQIAYFKNAFDQGEYWHPGLISATNFFLKEIGNKFDVSDYYGHRYNTVYSNFIIAKHAFWKEWMKFADNLWSYSIKNSEIAIVLAQHGSYFSNGSPVEMKVFIQERLASLVLALIPFKVGVVDISGHFPIYNQLFKPTPLLKNLLLVCDQLKLIGSFYNDEYAFSAYLKIRELITIEKKNFFY